MFEGDYLIDNQAVMDVLGLLFNTGIVSHGFRIICLVCGANMS